jgi:diacylglycerol kinase
VRSAKQSGTGEVVRPLSDARQRSGSAIPKAWQRRIQRTSNLAEAFYHAFVGLKVAVGGERNLKIQCVAGTLAIALAEWLGFDAISWCLLFLAIGVVVTAEMLNTAIERVVDLAAGGEYHALARDAKDVAAGAVVIASVTAAAIGLTLYLPRLWTLFHTANI